MKIKPVKKIKSVPEKSRLDSKPPVQKRKKRKGNPNPKPPTVIDEEYQNADGSFKKGNPGKPKGAISHRTRFMNLILGSFGEKEIKVFRQFFKNPNYKYLSALDRVVAVAGIDGKTQDSGQEMPPYQLIIEGQDEPTVANKEKSGKDIPK